MERGVRLLAHDADAFDALRIANRAVAAALARRLARVGAAGTQPRWRAFQLAFILLNLPGISEPASPEREFVDLLFFPTGGGKTEAYLGLAAFTMVLRRLRNPDDLDREGGLAGAGVSVIMRYTLGLLTLDQLSRAAGLVRAARPRASPRHGPARRLALRDRPLGRQGRHAEPPRRQGRWALGLRPQQGQPVQEQSGRQAVSDPARELPVVRRRLRPGVLHAAPRFRPPDGSPRHVRELAVRFLGRPAPPHRRR